MVGLTNSHVQGMLDSNYAAMRMQFYAIEIARYERQVVLHLSPKTDIISGTGKGSMTGSMRKLVADRRFLDAQKCI